jgi:RecB family exonuclease
MSSLDELRRDRRVVLCIDDRFDDVQSLGQNYSETIQKALAALGPLKRNELELLFRHWEFTNLFSDAEVVVLMAETTLKHSLIWKRLFAGIDLIETEKAKPLTRPKVKDRFLELPRVAFSGSFSASKFQTYQDCPRRFFYSYVDKLFPNISMSTELDALATGTISHKIIEEFYKRSTPLDELPKLGREIMEGYLLENGINLSLEASRRHELVFRHRSTNGITFLKELESILKVEIPWKMEEAFQLSDEYELRGKIDCMGVTQEFLILLDFKSTKSSTSSFKEIESYESLQLWAYSMAAAATIGDIEKRKVLIGYVSLDNPADSNLMTDDESLFENLKASRLCRVQQFEHPFAEALTGARQHMKELTKKILSDVFYQAKPRKPESCRYCELKKVCLKGEALA